jgi:hypothetical protein
MPCTGRSRRHRSNSVAVPPESVNRSTVLLLLAGEVRVVLVHQALRVETEVVRVRAEEPVWLRKFDFPKRSGVLRASTPHARDRGRNPILSLSMGISMPYGGAHRIAGRRDQMAAISRRAGFAHRTGSLARRSSSTSASSPALRSRTPASFEDEGPGAAFPALPRSSARTTERRALSESTSPRAGPERVLRGIANSGRGRRPAAAQSRRPPASGVRGRAEDPFVGFPEPYQAGREPAPTEHGLLARRLQILRRCCRGCGLA